MPEIVSNSTAVDLSRLPAPDIVEALSYEEILLEQLADLRTRMGDAFDALVESDPVLKLLEVTAYRELIIRQRINDAARALLLASAERADLDNLGALYGVVRLQISPATADADAVMESDTDLRRRISLAPEGFSVAGPVAAYEFHALSADGDVADAKCISPSPGEVTVSILSRSGIGEASDELLDKVRAAFSAPVRPLTDHVTVAAAELVDFVVDADLYYFDGPDAALVRSNAYASCIAWLNSARRIGRDIPRSAIIATLHVEGVQRVVLNAPLADIPVSNLQAGRCLNLDLHDGGLGD